MMNQMKVVFDMIAGILAGMQVLLPKGYYEKVDNYLIGELRDTVTHKGSLRWLWLIGGIIVTVTIIVMLVFSSIIKDLNQGRVAETVVFITGFIVGITILAIITRFYRLISGLRDFKPTEFAFLSGMILGIISFVIVILLAGRVSVLAITFLVPFSVSSMIMGILFLMMPAAKRFLTFQSGVLLRVGVIMFIIARVIELKNG